MRPLPEPRDVEEAEKMRAVYVAAAADVLFAVRVAAPEPAAPLSPVLAAVGRIAAGLWPKFPQPQRA
jgi:hypothetical protein